MPVGAFVTVSKVEIKRRQLRVVLGLGPSTLNHCLLSRIPFAVAEKPAKGCALATTRLNRNQVSHDYLPGGWLWLSRRPCIVGKIGGRVKGQRLKGRLGRFRSATNDQPAGATPLDPKRRKIAALPLTKIFVAGKSFPVAFFYKGEETAFDGL